LQLDDELLALYPEGYRRLAYLQSKNGFKIKAGLPGLRGPAVEKLYAEGKAWLAGSAQPGEPL
ncbi:MAG: nuclear transport factor 2 family protein, partial [Chloroflexi bacterium]|nr:nuclear transport factor 2 family protein [Chloroflexota bacterium]